MNSVGAETDESSTPVQRSTSKVQQNDIIPISIPFLAKSTVPKITINSIGKSNAGSLPCDKKRQTVPINIPVYRATYQGEFQGASGRPKLNRTPRTRPSASSGDKEDVLLSSLGYFKKALENHKAGKPVTIMINGEQKILKGREEERAVTFRLEPCIAAVKERQGLKASNNIIYETPQQRLTRARAANHNHSRATSKDPAGAVSSFKNATPIQQELPGPSKALKPILVSGTKRRKKLFQDLLIWDSNIDILSPELQLSKHNHPHKKLELKHIARFLDVSIKDVTELNIFKERTCDSGKALMPDIYKFLAFAAYQRNKIQKAAYWFSLSHGYLLRADILDRQMLFASREEDFPKVNNLERLTREKTVKLRFYSQNWARQMQFGCSRSMFQDQINSIDPNWNIIQLSTMPMPNHLHYLAGNDSVKNRTPPLFLTCFITIPKLLKRVSYVTYIPKPKKCMQDLFLKLMSENRTINSFAGGCPKIYWEARAQQNRNLKTLIEEMEHSWIAPFAFLFPGGMMNESVSKSIWTTVEALGNEYKLGHDKWVLIYKLIENYKMLDVTTQSQFKPFIKALLDISKKDAVAISGAIQNVAFSLVHRQERHPTILVLDQDIEEYPWDWMTCLRSTDVTRMPSLYAIDAAFHLSPKRITKFPAFVKPPKCSFVLNPDSTLQSTQMRLDSYFRSRTGWEGVSGRSPTESELQRALEYQHVFLYCGHGTGFSVLPEYMVAKLLCRNAAILMGCASLMPRLPFHRSLTQNAAYTYFVAGCPSVVGFLWEVTDVECDRVTVELLEHWLPGPGALPEMHAFDNKTKRHQVASLVTAVRRARMAATQFMTEAGLVCYGLPVYTRSTW